MITFSLVAFGLLLAAWVVYPLIMAMAATRHATLPRLADAALPTVSVIIATRDAPDVIRRRVEDIRANGYPHDRLEMIVAVDHRGDYGVATVAAELGNLARVIRGDAPGGKATALNAGVAASTGEVLVFADSKQTFESDAVRRLVEFLADRRYGAVSGSVVHKSGDGLMDLYWEYELLIRRGQTAMHSIVSTSGQIQAVRRELWIPLPAELICDDLFVTMQVVMQGHRVGYTEEARVRDPRKFTKQQHYQRKVRTLTGLVQFCAWVPGALLPWRNPIWLHFVFHKLMRILTPYLALLVVLGAAVAMPHLAAPMLLGAGVTLAAGALLLAMVRPALLQRLTSSVGWLVALQAAPVIAVLNGVRGHWAVWQFHRPLEGA